MKRREFCLEGGRMALGVALAPALVWRRQQVVGPRDPAWSRLLSGLETEIQELMTHAGVPGVSIAVVSEGALAWRRGFGIKDVRSKAPVDEQTVFEAASTSKPLFAYVVMKLCERRVLDLDTPLVKYVPGRILEGDARSDLVTARHILSHTSGLPNWRSPNEPLAFQFTPGERWQYSGEGYSYLQAVVSRLSGSRTDQSDCGLFEAGFQVCATEPSIDAYMQRNLLKPFAMSSSGYLWTPQMEANVAWGHDPNGQPLKSSRKPSRAAVARYGMAGGLCTTPTDYAKFLIEVLNPKPADTFRITAASRAEMLRAQVRRNAVSSWALGWEINHTDSGDFIRHGGGNPGYSCFVAGSLTHRSGYVIMTNSEEKGYVDVIAKLIAGDTLSQVIGGQLRDAPE